MPLLLVKCTCSFVLLHLIIPLTIKLKISANVSKNVAMNITAGLDKIAIENVV